MCHPNLWIMGKDNMSLQAVSKSYLRIHSNPIVNPLIHINPHEISLNHHDMPIKSLYDIIIKSLWDPVFRNLPVTLPSLRTWLKVYHSHLNMDQRPVWKNWENHEYECRYPQTYPRVKIIYAYIYIQHAWHACRQAGRQTDRQTDRDRQEGRQAGRQAGRQTHTHTHFTLITYALLHLYT